MNNQSEKRGFSNFIPERFRIPKDILTTDFDKFIEIIDRKKPDQLNISIVDQSITSDGSPALTGKVDYYKLATLFSFDQDLKRKSIVSYIEDYPESRVFANDGNPDIEKLGIMKMRAIITVMNRIRRLTSRFPLLQTQVSLVGSRGELQINSASLEFIQKEAQKLKLSPFII